MEAVDLVISDECLRNLYAGIAMHGLVTAHPQWEDDFIAIGSYELADAMLRQKNKEKPVDP